MSGDGNVGSDLSIQLANLLKNGLNLQPQNTKLSNNLQINLKRNRKNYALWTRMSRVAIGRKSRNLLKLLTSDPSDESSGVAAGLIATNTQNPNGPGPEWWNNGHKKGMKNTGHEKGRAAIATGSKKEATGVTDGIEGGFAGMLAAGWGEKEEEEAVMQAPQTLPDLSPLFFFTYGPCENRKEPHKP
ncbi:hypothetical protein Hdeb2414_s0006g00200721 [Helianthus debilis subsp. tardiflorus]